MAVTNKAAVRISLLFLFLVALQFAAVIRQTRILDYVTGSNNSDQHQQPQKPWELVDDGDDRYGGYGDDNYDDAPMAMGPTKPSNSLSKSHSGGKDGNDDSGGFVNDDAPFVEPISTMPLLKEEQPLLDAITHSSPGSNNKNTLLSKGDVVAEEPLSNNSRDNNNNTPKTKKRPWMVIHVGPPKTGTSTIQMGFKQRAADLAALDNVFYVGVTVGKECVVVNYTTNTNTSEEGNSSSSNQQHPSTFTTYTMSDFVYLRGGIPEQPYLKDILRHHAEGHNLVVSSEHYTSKMPLRMNNTDRYFERIFDYTFLRDNGRASKLRLEKYGDLLDFDDDRSEAKRDDYDDDGDGEEDAGEEPHRRHLSPATSLAVDESDTFGFDVSVVVAYRHFFQWIPSYYFQSELINKQSGHTTRVAYIENVLEKLPREYFSTLDLLADWSLLDWNPDLSLFHGSLYSYARWSSQPSLRNRVRILDMHSQEFGLDGAANNQTHEQQVDLVREFICGHLPSADKTCALLSGNETAPLVVRTRRKRAESALETGKLTSTEELRLKLAAKERLPILGMRARKAHEHDLAWLNDLDPSMSIYTGKDLRRAKGKSRGPRFYLKAKFNRWVEKRKQKLEAGVDDGHRQLCLSGETLERLRVASWNMLRHLEAMVRESSASGTVSKHRHERKNLLLSPSPVADTTTTSSSVTNKWKALKAAHDDLFDEAVNSGAYCEIDIDRLFRDEDFVRQVLYHTSKG